MSLELLKEELLNLKNPVKAKVLQGFFKTGKDEYGEGDVFLGIVVPIQRKIAKKYYFLSLKDLQKLIDSKIHEERLTCLFILIERYKKTSEKEKEEIYNFYIKNAKKINNWDLVDLSAPSIIGEYIKEKDRNILYKLVKSENLWERRIAMLSCFSFIRKNDFKDAFAIASELISDKQDLIHKAVGWMLREIGKRDLKAEENFLREYYQKMPRTMLRYSIEKFPHDKRKKYLEGKI